MSVVHTSRSIPRSKADCVLPITSLAHATTILPAPSQDIVTELGDPYTRVGQDQSGRAGIDWGVYGVPETFVINGDGVIVYKHVGPIQNRDVEQRIRPAIAEALGQNQ